MPGHICHQGARVGPTYEVIHDGRSYPPKAVFGLAAASLLGTPVGPADFTAGEGSVCFRLLRELGFQIARQDAAPDQQTYWALLANPLQFDIVRASEELDELTWMLPRGDPAVGDRLLFWKAKGRDGDRGVVALGEVIEQPAVRALDPEVASYFVAEPQAGVVRGIVLRLLGLPSGPLWLGGDADELLNEFTVASAQGNKLYRVTAAQWEQLMARIGGWPDDDKVVEDAIEGAMSRAGRARGQRFSSSPAFRRAVERRAMDMVREYYEGLGYTVRDTSANRPYDFVAARADERLFVEVKGTTGAGERVFLTKNEVAHARAHAEQSVLAVVAGIEVAVDDGEHVASGGDLQLVRPWAPASRDLLALSYQYAVPRAT